MIEALVPSIIMNMTNIRQHDEMVLCSVWLVFVVVWVKTHNLSLNLFNHLEVILKFIKVMFMLGMSAMIQPNNIFDLSIEQQVKIANGARQIISTSASSQRLASFPIGWHGYQVFIRNINTFATKKKFIYRKKNPNQRHSPHLLLCFPVQYIKVFHTL